MRTPKNNPDHSRPTIWKAVPSLMALATLFLWTGFLPYSEAQNGGYPPANGTLSPVNGPHRTGPDQSVRSTRSSNISGRPAFRTGHSGTPTSSAMAPRQMAGNAPVYGSQHPTRPGNARPNAQVPLSFHERSPENPVRFVFTPQKSTSSDPTAPWDESPSAKAIWSTFLTGDISPELVRWHVNQRKKVEWEKRVAMSQNQGHEGAENFDPNAPLGTIIDQPLAVRTGKNRTPSEYSQMIHRMEFSLAAENGTTPGNSPYKGMTAPSSNAILLQLLTGHKNQEMTGWKENLIAASQASPTGWDPSLMTTENPMMVVEVPVRSTIPDLTSNIPNGGMRAQPLSGGYAYAPTALNAPLTTVVPSVPHPANAPVPADRIASSTTLPSTFGKTQTGSPTPSESSVAAARPQTNRFIDDQFPMARPANYASPEGTIPSTISPVSASLPKERGTTTPSLLSNDEEISRPGQVKVYHSPEIPAENVMRSLPERNGRSDSSSSGDWNPME